MQSVATRLHAGSNPVLASVVEEDPNKPFSVARVAVWALGIIALASVLGLIFLAGQEQEVSTTLKAITQTAIGALAAVAASTARK